MKKINGIGMRWLLLLCISVTFHFPLSTFHSAQAQRVLTDNFDRLTVHYTHPQVVSRQQGDWLTLSAAGYIAGGQIGTPAVPVMSSLIAVPLCDEMVVTVENAVYDTVALGDVPVRPLQPSQCKSREALPFVFDEEVYATDAFHGRPLADVEYLGTGRDRNYALLTYAPVSVNPVTGQMVVCRSADVTVHYVGSDASTTLKQYERYHTPAFTLGQTLNTLYTNAKSIRTTAPVRMVIMAPQQLQCTALDEFVDWKRQQGMIVDLNYVANNASAASIASQLQQMYDEASDAAPAPTYLILVGDNEQLPAFASDLLESNENHWYQLDDHITDLYYVTWTSDDKLPDCYQGRFSATDTTTLRNIIDKTLYYERYLFADDSYLARAALVAGEDNGYHYDYYDHAWSHCDPSMDYIAKYYVNAENGYDTVVYFKNDVDNAPEGVTVTGYCSTSRAPRVLRDYYNTGVGWINYSAHGDWNYWYKPRFDVDNARQMTNNDMPSFMIGNCCLTSKFDEGTCLSEALLRKGDRAGAVAYIGATNSTFWDEDFYWAIGVRDGISHTMTLEYDVAHKGTYDHLFHTHAESLADHIATAGQMLMTGNMVVNSQSGTSTGASNAEYYWEIYELMGDPSLLPWMGRASDLTVTVGQLVYGMTVAAAPGAYVAVVRASDHALVASAFADADGNAFLDLPSDMPLDNSRLLSVTAQGYKPYLKGFGEINVGIDELRTPNSELTICPNPASGSTVVSAEGLRRVTLFNTLGQTLQTVSATADACRLDLSALNAGLYLLRIETADGTATSKLVVK